MGLARFLIFLCLLLGCGCATNQHRFAQQVPFESQENRSPLQADVVAKTEPKQLATKSRVVSASFLQDDGETPDVLELDFEMDEPDLDQSDKDDAEVVETEPSKSDSSDLSSPDSSSVLPTRAMGTIGTQVSSYGLTLEQIEQAAMGYHPAIAEISARLEAAQGKLTQAGLPPNPVVGVRSTDIFEEGSSGRYGVYFGRQVVRGNKLEFAQSVVCAEIKVLEQQFTMMKLRLMTDVHQRFYELLVAQEKVKLAQNLVGISANAAEVSSRLFEAEEVARTAVLQSKLELQNANIILRRAENQRLASRRKLAALIGEADLSSTEVAGDVRQLVELEDFEFWYDELLQNSPEIKALFADVDRARRQLDREIVKPIPNVTWQGAIDYDTVSDNFLAGFQVGMPIPTLDKNQGAIYQAQNNVVAAQRLAEKKALDLRQRLASSYERYLDAKLQLDAYDAEIIPNAEETLELFLTGYKQGETNVLQLLTAQRTYFQTNLAYLESLQQMWQQSVEVRGLLLKNSLN